MKHFTKSILVMAAALISMNTNASHLRDQILLSARMSGTQEVPAVATNAVGVAGFTLSSHFDSLRVNMTVSGLSGAITGAHVHRAAIGSNGPVVFNLIPFLNGNTVSAVITGSDLTPALLAEYLGGKLYVNVHTTLNPGGEIRGQITPETDIQFIADLRGEQENPPVAGAGYGLGIFTLSQDSSRLSIHVVANGLTGDITGAHFHNAATGTNGPVVLNLLPFASGTTISTSVGTTAFLSELLAGNIYINFHTAANPSGEIRGQLYRDDRIAFDAVLTGDQETPPVTSTAAMGVANIKLNSLMDTLTYDIQYTGLSGAPTGAHLYIGETGVSGLVLYDMSANISGNRTTGMVTGFTLSNSFLSNLLQGNLYVNIHTASNPDGEIRGQVYRVLREGYSTIIEGAQQVPATSSTAKGTALVSIDRNQTNLHFMVATHGISPSGIHFHKGIAGENGPVIFDIQPFYVNEGAFGFWKSGDTSPFTLGVSNLFRSDSVYINLHTSANPNGEIRGQMERGFYTPIVTAKHTPMNANSFVLYPIPATNTLNFKALLGGANHLKVFNNVGACVLEQEISSNSDRNALDVSGLKTGVYLMQIQSAEGNYMQRFSKE